MADAEVTPRPALAAQASQAVVWNTLFLPAKFLADLGVTLLQFNLLSLVAVGVLGVIRSTVGGIGVWVDLGIERALPKFIPETERSAGRGAVRQLIARVMALKLAVLAIFTAGLWLLRDQFLGRLSANVGTIERISQADRADVLRQIEQNGYIFIGAIVLLLVLGAIYDVLLAYLISYFRQRAWNSISLANALLLPLLISLAILWGWDITGVVVAMVATAGFGVALAIWQVGRIARSAPREERPAQAYAAPWRRFVPYSALSYLFNVSDFFASQWFAVFLLAGNLPNAAILWNAMNLVRQVLSYLYTPLVGLQVPLFTRARAGEGASLPGAYAAVTRVLLLLLVPGGVGLVLLARPLVLAQYPRYVEAVPTIMLLTPLLFLESLLSTSQNALMVSERYVPIIVARTLAFVSIPLLLILLPRYGVVGAAAALGIARVLAGLVVFVAGRRLLDLRFPWAFALRLGLASGVMGLSLLGLTRLLPDTVALLRERAALGDRLLLFSETLLIAAIAGAVFVVVFRLLGGLDVRDRQQLAATRLPLKRLVLKVL